MNSWGVRPTFCPKAKQPINLLHSNFIHICILMLLHISVLMHYIQNHCKSLTKIILNKLEDRESVPKRNTLILKALKHPNTTLINCFTLVVKWPILIRRSSIFSILASVGMKLSFDSRTKQSVRSGILIL